MRILLLGSGGREHALSWKMSQSPDCEALYIAPGNAGTAQHGTNLSIGYNDFDAVKKAVIDQNIDLLVVGPEEPLVNGIVDFCQNDPALQHLHVIGPSKESAQLEGSKAYAKEFMAENNIPTASYKKFNGEQISEAQAYIATCNTPIVLKADGLAAGKGVLIINDIREAQEALAEMLGGKFGAASSEVVIEEYLSGLEFSVFVLTDGKNYKILPVAKDYKRIGEGDTGLNTGGMGAVSPVPFVDKVMMDKVIERVVKPTITGLEKRSMEYKGFVFIGLIEVEGEPFVIEYNCRLGDPETEVVLPRVDSDLLPLFASLKDQKLNEINMKINPSAAATVMLVSGGYPEAYHKGKQMLGLDETENSILFHAGTKMIDSNLVTNGGRVLAITSLAEEFQTAIDQSMINAKKIQFEGKYFRTDIGFDL